MKKTLFISLIFLLGLVLSFQVVKSKNSNSYLEDLLLNNVEALARTEGGDGGLLLFRVCSKKTGPIHCSTRRGNRKWAMNVVLKFGVGGPVCSECPDQDFDYQD